MSTPGTSSLRPASAGVRGTNPTASRIAAAQIGRLIAKAHRQLPASTIAPPTSGPAIGAIVLTSITTVSTRPILVGPAARIRIVCSTGSRMPAPMPCSARKATREPKSQATAHRPDPARNRASPAIHSCLAPKRSDAHAVTGTVTASASR